MPPKKAKKISLNEFLGDSALGSWADEMDQLPSAPAVRTDEERANDRYGGRRGDDFLSSRPDRSGPPREDIPLPTQPPYTAFIGNLSFDLTEQELGDFFEPIKTKTIKIIKDREEKPKGFGYIEFEDLEGLKDALAKHGSNFSGRTIRVSVAEPPKDRPGFSSGGGGFEDEAKFDNPWRREGPLPPSMGRKDDAQSRDSSRRRFDGPDRTLPSVSEGPSDWRGSRPARASPAADNERDGFKRKGSGFSTPDGAADREEVWTMGSKFKPAPTVEEGGGSKFGSARGRSEMGPPRDPPPPTVADEVDWRSMARAARPAAKNSTSPTSSTPPTPQLNRRKLELLPRSGNPSATPSPLSSPKMGPTPTSTTSSIGRSNPFGAARPVDVTNKEKEVSERIEKDRLTMSRTNSRAGTERPIMTRTNSRPGTERAPLIRTNSRPASTRSPPPGPASPTPPAASPPTSATKSTANLAPSVRPTLSFAGAAGGKKVVAADKESEEKGQEEVADNEENDVDTLAEKVEDVTV